MKKVIFHDLNLNTKILNILNRKYFSVHFDFAVTNYKNVEIQITEKLVVNGTIVYDPVTKERIW